MFLDLGWVFFRIGNIGGEKDGSLELDWAGCAFNYLTLDQDLHDVFHIPITSFELLIVSVPNFMQLG